MYGQRRENMKRQDSEGKKKKKRKKERKGNSARQRKPHLLGDILITSLANQGECKYKDISPTVA